MCLKNIRLVTFDVTNTLLKFRQSPARQYVEAGRAHGFHLNEELISAQFRLQYKDMWRRHPNFGSTGEISWDNWWREVVSGTFSKYVSNATAVDAMASQLIQDYKKAELWLVSTGAHELLQHLKQNRITVGALSNFDPRLHDILTNVKLNHLLDFIITSYECGYHKPDCRIFDAARAKCGVDAEYALHIGDNAELDYCGARNAGWHALIVNSKHPQNVPLQHVFSDLNQLKDCIIANKVILSNKHQLKK